MNNIEEDINILKEFINDYKIAEEIVDENLINAIENILRELSNLDKTNNDLRLLYRRTAKKLQENGKEELAGYFLAQIDEVPTFVVDDDIDYYKEYHKQKERITELEAENRIQRSQLMSAFDRGFIPKQVIIDAIARNLEKDSAGRLVFDFNSCQKLAIEIVKLMREGI